MVHEPPAAAPAAADVLRFYSGSADVRPGKGKGERVADPGAYSALAARPHWRRTLSNFHEAEFEYRGRTYRTIEHAFQAAKIGLVDPQAAAQFALESGSELARGDGLVARKHRKLVVLPKAVIAQWDGMSARVMAEIAACKFAQCPDARATLHDTGRAELWHAAPRMQPVRFEFLERIRGEPPL